ncbi:MOSC domain-containing protein [Streptosporangium sp. NPDC023615]|uniref:MOSC domain-containing protein n=1 Tax=Streptosporangium sp. NPDC023615 TaxID=3154794 RepID=UPI00343B5762
MASYFGTVRRIFRWPVKSLRGEELRRGGFDGRGLIGDRAYALVDERESHAGKVLTVRHRPEMLHWHAAYTNGPPGAGEAPPGSGEPLPGGAEASAGGVEALPWTGAAPTLTAPDGTVWAWEAPGLADALAESLNTPLSLRAADGQHDRALTVLVTFEASLAALGQELGMPVEVERFRPNLHLDLDAPAFDEEDWETGTTLTVGEVELAVTGERTGPCVRCVVPSWDPLGRERLPELQKWLIAEHRNRFGVIMRVTRPGTARVGDGVTAASGPERRERPAGSPAGPARG